MPSLSDAWQTVKGSKTTLPDTFVDLSGKTVIVTGSNAGLGRILAGKFSKMKPAKLILGVRSSSKGEAARQEMLDLNPTSGVSSIEVWPLDMADLASVKAFSDRAYTALERLDVLVCNAGMRPISFTQTKDNWETCLQVNGIATLYLAILLTPLMQRTSTSCYLSHPPSSTSGLSKPHLSVISSGLHFMSTFPLRKEAAILSAMNDRNKFDGPERYNDTKLINLWSAKSLAQRVGDSIVVNSVNPGWCPASGLSNELRKSSAGARIGLAVMGTIFGRSMENGARSLAWGTLASSVNGAYVANCEDQPGSSFANSEEGIATQQRLWKEITETLLKFDPSLAQNPIISA